MKPSAVLKAHRDFVIETILAHRALNPKVFGSVLTGEDTDESDLDILVETTDDTSLLDLAKIECQLHEKLGIKVDILTPDFLPDSFRNEVLETAVAI